MTSKNIQFSIAVHIMTGLAFHKGEYICSATLAESVNAYPSFVRRILSKLSKAGLVSATRGKHGSCAIAKSADTITMLDIYNAVEMPKGFSIHSYPPKDSCPVSCGMKTAMENILSKAQKSFEDTLQSIYLSEIIKEIN